MAVFGELSQVSSAHTVLSIENVFPPILRDIAFLHLKYILQAFVQRMSFVKRSYFSIKNFPSLLKAKVAFEIGLLLIFAALALSTILYAVGRSAHIPSLVLGD
ncbi:hypothetical protein ILYODFUR_008305 [Ilyodon furcidens]|uniref:Uncharacterized protein n=4 Tax=Goodeidae TaxID=28758 RepID=A0ABV0P514_9TELE|nr:hypothetical protein [Characodon lateralis]